MLGRFFAGNWRPPADEIRFAADNGFDGEPDPPGAGAAHQTISMSPNALGLVEVDQALLEQLQHGQEADDHLEPLDQAVGEPAERDAPDPGQLVDQLGRRRRRRWRASGRRGTGRCAAPASGSMARRKACAERRRR